MSCSAIPAAILKRSLLLYPLLRLVSVEDRRDRDRPRAPGPRPCVPWHRRRRTCLAQGRPILIFPEGTRKKPGAAPDYKPGAAGLYMASWGCPASAGGAGFRALLDWTSGKYPGPYHPGLPGAHPAGAETDRVHAHIAGQDRNRDGGRFWPNCRQNVKRTGSMIGQVAEPPPPL